MIDSALRTSWSPIVDISTSSMTIEPETASTIRKRATIMDDLPAPVLPSSSATRDTAQRSNNFCSPSYDTDFLPARHRQSDSLQDRWKFRSVFDDQIRQLHFAFGRPRRGWFVIGNLVWCFLFDLVGIVDESFYRVHVVLDLSELPDYPPKRLQSLHLSATDKCRE